MSTFRDPVGNFTFESLVGFLGALLVFPLVLKLVFGTIKTLFKLRIIRKLLFGAAVTGLVATLQNEGVLDKLFGEKGALGDGFLKPDAHR